MSDALAPGFFGKVPARGDFLSRRLPPEVAAVWENWLDALILAVRGTGERGWQDAWLTAPLWHFVLGRGLAPPEGAAGVLVASADRVGRLFPFSVIGRGHVGAAHAAGEWARRAEALALSAMEEEFDPGTLDAGLSELGPPPPVGGASRPVGVWPLVLDGEWPIARDPLAEEAAAQTGAGPEQSEWWCRGSDRVVPVRLRCSGLPAPLVARAMVLGGADLQPGALVR